MNVYICASYYMVNVGDTSGILRENHTWWNTRAVNERRGIWPLDGEARVVHTQWTRSTLPGEHD
jgi:hypothetical protein